MDQSAAQLEVIRAYGSSDVASPSFDYPRYVKHASVHQPYDLGKVDAFDATLQGMIGAESGSQTLFFSFETLSPARIGLRMVCGNDYEHQYTELTLSDDSGQIPLGIDSFANSTLLSPLQVATVSETVISLSYVASGYWTTGYAFNDGASYSVPSVTIGTVEDAGASFRSPYGAIMPAGKYRFTVTSSVWPQLCFCAQLAVVPPGRLAATIESRAEPIARIALAKPAGAAECLASPAAQLVAPRLLVGVATGAAAPTAEIDRVSPYGT